jgi:hypothetical protein
LAIKTALGQDVVGGALSVSIQEQRVIGVGARLGDLAARALLMRLSG